ncbi:MAG: type II toxin-antitoxin system Phd/YefM family antitoxin [Thermodesulfobacteriota bacterium]
MITLNIHEAKATLSACLARVSSGETVILCKRNQPIAEIRPLRKKLRKRRPIGLARQEFPDFTVDKAFFEPLPEDLTDAFLGEGP